MSTSTSTVTAREAAEIAAANASGKQPVVFVHGLWLLAESWKPWRDLFEAQGYSTVAVDWPGDEATYAEAHANPDSLAGTGVAEVADHVAEVIAGLAEKPVVVGHSFGGLLVQIIAGRGLAAATISIDPAPSQGILALPLSTLKASSPVLSNPFNYSKTVTLTFDQFRYGFANVVPEDEAKRLYETAHTPGPGRPLFQAASANFNPFAVTKVDVKNPARGPMLVVSGENDHIVPFAVANATYKKQSKNTSSATEFVEIPGVGHSLIIDNGWQVVADAALAFLTKQGVTAK